MDEHEREELVARLDAGIASARGTLELLEELVREVLGADLDPAAQLCRLLADGIAAYAPRPRISATWLREARRLLELDDVPLEEAAEMVEWLTTSEEAAAVFWRGNVLGMPKFRARYARLMVERARARAGTPAGQAARIADKIANGRRR